jgi:titin
VQSSGADVDLSCSSTTPCRWGDYSGASPDPSATGTVGKVWLGNQYNLAGGTTSSTSWRTWLFAVTPTGGAPPPPPGTLSFATAAQTLTAGQPSAAIQLGLAPAQPSDVNVSLSSSSAQGQFSISGGDPWSSTLQVTVPATQTTSPSFYYRDTKAGSATLTASASGVTGTTQSETVNAGPAATITVTPTGATLPAGGTQLFTATATDGFNNPVSTAGAGWSTTVSGGSVAPATGASTTFTAGTTAGSGTVRATIGAASGSANVTVTTAPPAPTGLVASVVKGRIVLSWNGGGSGVTYRVYRGTSPGGESATPYATGVTGTSFNDASVVSRTTYYYQVTAAGPGGESAPSNEAHAKAR